jgi:hypothetical protein
MLGIKTKTDPLKFKYFGVTAKPAVFLKIPFQCKGQQVNTKQIKQHFMLWLPL